MRFLIVIIIFFIGVFVLAPLLYFMIDNKEWWMLAWTIMAVFFISLGGMVGFAEINKLEDK